MKGKTYPSYGTRAVLKIRHLNRILSLMPMLLAAVLWAGVNPRTPAEIGIINFGQVNPNYYRGGQPDYTGFERIAKLKIKTVIDLQEDGKAHEPTWVHAAGMQYFNIPLSSRRPATEGQTKYFLSLVNNPQNQPVYVHCAGGRHRTGEMTAIYRMTHDGWTADLAYREMKQYGFYSRWGHGSLKKYVYDYFRKHQTPQSGTRTSTTASAGELTALP